MPGERILIVEDEPGIVDFVSRGLEADGYEVAAAGDGITGTEAALQEATALVILDLMLPGRSGQDVLAQLQAERPELPVMVLTARGEIDERVAGLDLGAVDYMVKPFSLSELRARVRAHLRSAGAAAPVKLRAGELEADLLTREVLVGGEGVRLSAKEFELLCHLLRNIGRVLSREDILRAVWGYDHDPTTNVVDVYVGYLRRKLSRPGWELPIVTVRSIGYRFDGR